ncbi:MAG TPA: hypothetical protein PKC39_08170 [Ferruginibacter sp.]|nr:hypothetical protein [Ferruginibacter sp.]HMP20920.1 hypothetical protein [Ferruginibacter sp.]
MKNKPGYTFCQKLSAICLIFTLSWLTVSIAFVSDSRAATHKQVKGHTPPLSADTQEDDNNPLTNTEEKNPSPNSIAEEFLHDHYINDHISNILLLRHVHENDDTYTAFHDELHAPPPNMV